VNAYLVLNKAAERLIRQFEGPYRLTARECEGGAWELGPGVTFYPDDRGDVQPGDTCTMEEAEVMFRNAIRLFENGVRDMVTVELSPNQFSALCSFAYNCGLENLASSTLLRMVNLRRWDDAAASFGMWIYATKNGYKRALRGLLRRRYAEACLFLGYDWTQACSDDAIALQVKPPASIPGKDEVVYKTSFRDVLAVAYHYPLPSLEDDDFFEAVNPPLVLEKTAQEASPVAGAGSPGATQPSGGPVAPTKSTSPASVVPSPAVAEKQASTVAPASSPAAPVGTKPLSPNTVKPAEVPYRINVDAGLKPLDESNRAKGYWYQQAGIGVIRLGTLGVFGSGAAKVSSTLQGDPVLSNMVLTVVVLGGIFVTGYVTKKYGDWKRKKAEREATQALY